MVRHRYQYVSRSEETFIHLSNVSIVLVNESSSFNVLIRPLHRLQYTWRNPQNWIAYLIRKNNLTIFCFVLNSILLYIHLIVYKNLPHFTKRMTKFSNFAIISCNGKAYILLLLCNCCIGRIYVRGVLALSSRLNLELICKVIF